MAQTQENIPSAVYENLSQIEKLLQRSISDPRPVALMVCGVAGSGKSSHARAVTQMFPTFKRISIDGILADRHGLCGIDYPKSDYEKYQNEADNMFGECVKRILADGRDDVILDRSFYAKEDRDFFRALIEKYGARCVLLHFDVPKALLWRRICARRRAGVNADCALEIDEELLDSYVEGFEVPVSEHEVVFRSSM